MKQKHGRLIAGLLAAVMLLGMVPAEARGETVKPGSILVQGQVYGTDMPVPGVMYQAEGTGGAYGTVQKAADSSGSVLFDDLSPGTYVVKAVGTPEGYQAVTGAQTIKVLEGEQETASFLFQKSASIVVHVLDNAGHGLEGAFIQFRRADGTICDQQTTGGDGYAASKALEPGSYIVEELFAPDGWTPDTRFQTVTVESTSGAIAAFTNSRLSVLTVWATDGSGMPLSGVQFAVSDSVTGQEVANLVTDESGTATTGSPLVPGAYMVKELAVPEGYLLTSSSQASVSVGVDRASVVRFTHTVQDTITVQTLDITTREAIGGAKYEIYNLNNDLAAEITTGPDGTGSSGPLEPGDYLVKQVLAPEGYKICSESQLVKLVSGRVLSCTFQNYRLTGITVEAVNQATHQPVAGVVFEIYDADGKKVFEDTTDSTGVLTTDTLPAGKYTIKQMNTPEGFSPVETVKIVTVTYDSVTPAVFELKAKTALSIELVDAETREGLEGGRFKVQDIGGEYITTADTDEEGSVLLSGLTAGKYMVTQVEAPEGYLLEGNYQWAELKTGEEITAVKFVNRKISGLLIRALDRNTGAPLAGAAFDIYDGETKLVKSVTTDSTGTASAPDLAPGSYLIKETVKPEGYEADTLTQTAEIKTGSYTTLTFNHVAQAGLVLKAVSAQTGEPVPGVTFTVLKPDGSLLGEFVTPESGEVSTGKLEPGSYTVHMSKVPEGYLLDASSRTVIVRTDAVLQEIFTLDSVSGLTLRVTEKQSGEGVSGVKIRIVDDTGAQVTALTTGDGGFAYCELNPGVYTGIMTDVPEEYVIDPSPFTFTIKANDRTRLELEIARISHMRIQVIDALTQRGVPGVDIEILTEVNNYVGRYRTDNEGYLWLDQVLAEGRYRLNMLSVPEGYIRDTQTKTVEVVLQESTDVKWPITAMQGQLTITTLSDTDNVLMGLARGSRLSGAVYSITDMTGSRVATIYSDSYGEAHSGALALGTYYVQQIQAPSGFLLNGQRVTVRVSSKNDAIRITVLNRSGNFSTSIEAHGPKTAAAGSQVKFYWTNIRNRSSVAVGNFCWSVVIPTDGARAGTFHTGTYTGTPAVYYIEYRTNTSDWRLLASGLSSKSQYSYDLSSLALNLQAGEYVTGIRTVFPAAPAGMHESMAPVLYVTVLPGLVNGYQLISRAECSCQGQADAAAAQSGSYGAASAGDAFTSGSWTSSSSQCTVTVTVPQAPLPPGLPNTGY